MTDDEALADVVRLHPERDLVDEDAPVSRKPREPFCAHKQIRLDPEARRAYCRTCDREVEPFAFLLDLAATWERYATHRRETERRARSANDRLQEILRLEKNARARLRRLDPEASAPAIPWGEGSVAF